MRVRSGISIGGWLCEVTAMFRILANLRILGVASAATLLGPSNASVPPPASGVTDIQPVAEQAAQPAVQPLPGPSQQDEAAFRGYVQLLAARARADGVGEATIRGMTADLTLNPRVIALDQSQPGTSRSSAVPAFAPYRRSHVDAARIAGGRRTYASVAGFAPEIERRFGVPIPIVVAIFGHETDYGNYKGDFDLARSLATLAFEGRRRELFAQEFVALLKMADQGVPRERLKGSWAGAFGNPQFLPSMYLRLAVDGDGDGQRNIWSSQPDTLASIANYFHDAGWRPGQPWGVLANVPLGLDRSLVAEKLNSPECSRVHARHDRWLTVAEWRRMGVQPMRPIADNVLATLFEPDGAGEPAYLLTGNYRVILHYNCSNFYAMTVGLLADEIAR
ncbi:MAG: lytic murein transglycosylase [Novosphingobium sp.]